MKGLQITGLALGCASLIFAICSWSVVLFWLSYLALPMSIVGLCLAVSGGKKAKAAGASAGIATAGMIVGIIAVVLSSITFVTCGLCGLCALIEAGDVVDDLEDLGSDFDYYY